MGLIDKEKTLHRMKVDIAPPFKVVQEMEEVDPIHAAGGCYCRECESCVGSQCFKKNLREVKPNGFCDEGRRREGGDG